MDLWVTDPQAVNVGSFTAEEGIRAEQTAAEDWERGKMCVCVCVPIYLFVFLCMFVLRYYLKLTEFIRRTVCFN